jgi:hypothetical protein
MSVRAYLKSRTAVVSSVRSSKSSTGTSRDWQKAFENIVPVAPKYLESSIESMAYLQFVVRYGH